MKKIPSSFLISGSIVLLLFVIFLVWGIPYFFQPVHIPGKTSFSATLGSQTVLARVTQIVDEGQIILNGKSQLYQVMRVEILEGDYKGIPFDIDYGKRTLRSDNFRFVPGDQVYVLVDKTPNNVLTAYYQDYVRSKPLFILLAAFVLSILIMGRWKGLGSLIALAISMFMIVEYVIPHILSGEDPVKVSLIGSGILLGLTLYLTYGWNLKTHASVLSMLLSLLLTGGLSLLFVYLTRLTGYGDENTLYLMQASSIQIDPRGLLLGGMIIGALGCSMIW